VTDQGPASKQTGVKPTIVLVHGAFADASSWNGVIGRLHNLPQEAPQAFAEAIIDAGS
jgi:pimeloyl-ACP methyl ester carboxylesterase